MNSLRMGFVVFALPALGFLLPGVPRTEAADPSPPLRPAESSTGSAPAPESPVEFTARERRRITRLSPLGAPPADPTNRVADDPRAARLGQRLFFDPRLSGPQSISCATCHDPSIDFADGVAIPATLDKGRRHTPSLWNVGWGRSFFWDGRADSLWAQAFVPVEDPREMGGDRLEVLRRLGDDVAVRAEFEALFGTWPDLSDEERFPERVVDAEGRLGAAWGGMAPADRATVMGGIASLGKALAAYQRQLVSGVTPFDRFAAALAEGGDDPSYPPAARRGLKLFVGRARCHLCHHGPTFSDQAFHATGVAPPPGKEEDPGRFGAFPRVRIDPLRVDGEYSDAPDGEAARRARGTRRRAEDYGAFRTPGLRNVARTAPYMHAGQLPTLEAVVRFYSDRSGALPPEPEHEDPLLRPLGLTDEEVSDLLAFLRTLDAAPPDPELLKPL